MKAKILICISILAVLLGGAHASLHEKLQHRSEPAHKQELLQTGSTTTVTTTTEAKTGTESEAEAECDPECLYKFPYIDSKCDEDESSHEPEVTVESGETFVEDASGCYTFGESESEGEEEHGESTETFVEEAHGCYEFELEVKEDLVHIIEECFHEEPKPTPHETSDESCDEPSHVYRYPFVHPGGDCDVTVDETYETIIIVNENVPIDGEVIVTVDEDGETIVEVIDEHGETWTGVPPDEVVHVDEGSGYVSSDDEHGETWTGVPPDEVVHVDEGSGYLSSDDEHGETWTGVPPDEVVHVDEGSGYLSSDDEHGETWTGIPPDEVVHVDEGSGYLGSDDEHGETWTGIPPDEVVHVDEGSGYLSSDDEHGETWTGIPPDEVVHVDEGSGEEFLPPYIVSDGEEEDFILQAEACYRFELADGEGGDELIVIVDETETPLPPSEEVTVSGGEGEEGTECIIGDTYESGTTIIYEQPTTYITWNRWDIHNHHHVSYTYVMTNIYSGVFKTDEYHYVIYGAGAINFYNTYYGIDAHVHDAPSCSCTCGYQTYTFTYQFGL